MSKITSGDIISCLESSLNEICSGISTVSHFEEQDFYIEVRFSSEELKGTLFFSSNPKFIDTVSPIKLTTKADQLDYCREFCNLLMGRFRYKLLDLGIDISSSIPKSAARVEKHGYEKFEKSFLHEGVSSSLELIYELSDSIATNLVPMRKLQPGKSVYYLDYEREINFNKELRWFTEVGGGLELNAEASCDFDNILNLGVETISFDCGNRLCLKFKGESAFLVDFLKHLASGDMSFVSHGHHFLLVEKGIAINIVIDDSLTIEYADFQGYCATN